MGSEQVTLAPTVPGGGPERRFSYFCLHWDSGLCLGVSPGPNEPVSEMRVQLKPYLRNVFKGVDHKKMRWDMVDDDFESLNSTEPVVHGFLRLEAQFPTLCADRRSLGNTGVFLFECTDQGVSHWFFDANKGVLRLAADTKYCATVTVCQPRTDKARSCKAPAQGVSVETNPLNFVEGSLIHVFPCFDSGEPSAIAYQPAQLFRREIDCVAGCSPEMQNNQRCDEICNNAQCASDKGECIDSPAPTPGSVPPTIDIDHVGGMPQLDAPNLWWLILLFLLMCCLATAAMFMRRRKRFKRIVDSEVHLGDGHSLMDSQSNMSVDLHDDEDEARFKTASAVALNQLRYHSRAASSSSTVSFVNGETVKQKRKPESSSNDKRHQFEEVGLV